MKRAFDLFLAFCALPPALILLAILAVAVKFTSRGPVLHWSERVGRNNHLFRMPKLRTMRADAPQVATHLLANPSHWITPCGRILRKTSLDELPQIWSILVGHMSFVGPRPALFNQEDLIQQRTRAGVHRLRPGVTGWAQINGRDNLSVSEKTQFDAFYLRNRSFLLDLRILGITLIQVARREGVTEGPAPQLLPAGDERRKAA